jgi:hypothetical protein
MVRGTLHGMVGGSLYGMVGCSLYGMVGGFPSGDGHWSVQLSRVVELLEISRRASFTYGRGPSQW